MTARTPIPTGMTGSRSRTARAPRSPTHFRRLGAWRSMSTSQAGSRRPTTSARQARSMTATNHFDGVNSQGYVAYWEKVGDLDLGDDLKLPMFIGFRSNKENGEPSPYLGQGWILPLLESNFVQTGENTFLMMQPDGWNNYFLRDNPNDTVLRGSSGWRAEITNDTITAWAPCVPSSGDRARGDRARGDRARGDRARGDRARGDRARGDRARGDRARGQLLTLDRAAIQPHDLGYGSPDTR